MTHADRPIGSTLADCFQDEAAFTDLEWRRVEAPLPERELCAAAHQHQIRAAWDWVRYSCD